MKRWAGLATLTTLIAVGCGGGSSHSSTPLEAKIESSIASGCKSRVVRTPYRGDPVHRQFQVLANQALVIGCQGHPDNRSVYARFDTPERAQAALASIVLPHASVESFCVVGPEAFTTDFWGSTPVCKRAGGRYQNVRRPPRPFAVTRTTYVANCGSTNYLEFKPRTWSEGCTAGSANVGTIRWEHWSPRRAIGSGTAGLRGGCFPHCSAKDAYYKAAATLRLSRPRPRDDHGVTLRYFSHVQWQADLRSGNPFDRPAGWWRLAYNAEAFKGQCLLTREGTLYGN
jgi:hypothetical protein